MFDNFSTRSTQAVFAARLKAGERGATEIDTDDFLIGLVLEDQGLLAKSLFPDIAERAFVGARIPSEHDGLRLQKRRPHVRFFSSELAESLLTNLKKSLPNSQSVPLNKDIPLSASLARVFDSAESLRAQFQHSQMEPLHLLSAILKERSGEGAKLLQLSGITLEGVLSALGGTVEN